MEHSDIKILLVDDEADTLEFMQYNLEKVGYRVFTAEDGHTALEKAYQQPPHLIILDIMMPEQDGIETCRKLREEEQFNDTLIAFLTARHEDYSQIAGFDVGADDYIKKPIKPRVFLSRIKGLLRRLLKEDAAVIEVGDISIDQESYVAYKEEKRISLPRKEFELLALLASKPGRVFSREEILNKVWGREVVVGDRTIDVHIRKLRAKLGKAYIQTVKGVGYKIEV